MLVQRIEPFPGEDWAGFLLRLAEANHLNGIGAISKIVGVSTINLLMQPFDTRLKWIDYLLGGPGCTSASANRRGFRGASYGYSQLSRICPKCLAEEAYIRAEWGRCFYVNCVRHAAGLVDTCPACDTRISVHRKSLTSCNCGQSLLSIPNSKPIEGEAWLIRLLDLQNDYNHVPRMFEVYSQRELAAAKFGWQYALLSTLDQRNGSDRSPKLTDPLIPIEMARCLASEFADWPNKFTLALDKATTLTKRRYFGRLAKLWNGHPDYLPIVRSYLQLRVDIRRKSPKPKLMFETALHPTRPVGIKQLMQSTRCTYDTAKHWIACGKLGTVKIVPGNKGQIRYQIDPDRVRNLSAFTRSLTSLPDASRILGIGNTATRSLMRSGKITSVQYGRSKHNLRFVTIAFFSFVQHVLDACVVVDRIEPDSLTLDELLSTKYAASIRRALRICNALDVQSIPLLRLKDGDGWSSVHITRSDYATWSKQAVEL